MCVGNTGMCTPCTPCASTWAVPRTPPPSWCAAHRQSAHGCDRWCVHTAQVPSWVSGVGTAPDTHTFYPPPLCTLLCLTCRDPQLEPRGAGRGVVEGAALVGGCMELWGACKGVQGSGCSLRWLQHDNPTIANTPPPVHPGQLEQVLYHLFIGVDLIYIYDNEDTPTYHRLFPCNPRVKVIHFPNVAAQYGMQVLTGAGAAARVACCARRAMCCSHIPVSSAVAIALWGVSACDDMDPAWRTGADAVSQGPTPLPPTATTDVRPPQRGCLDPAPPPSSHAEPSSAALH